MGKRPDAVFVLDTKKEHIAVTEANKLKIPVVAVVDTNVDPDVVQYPIPGNDDAIRSNSLFARVIADAVEEGRFIANKRNPAPAPVAERTPEQEAEFAAAQAALATPRHRRRPIVTPASPPPRPLRPPISPMRRPTPRPSRFRHRSPRRPRDRSPTPSSPSRLPSRRHRSLRAPTPRTTPRRP